MTRPEGELDDVALCGSKGIWAVGKTWADLDLMSFRKREGCQGEGAVRVLHVAAGGGCAGVENENVYHNGLLQSLASSRRLKMKSREVDEAEIDGRVKRQKLRNTTGFVSTSALVSWDVRQPLKRVFHVQFPTTRTSGILLLCFQKGIASMEGCAESTNKFRE